MVWDFYLFSFDFLYFCERNNGLVLNIQMYSHHYKDCLKVILELPYLIIHKSAISKPNVLIPLYIFCSILLLIWNLLGFLDGIKIKVITISINSFAAITGSIKNKYISTQYPEYAKIKHNIVPKIFPIHNPFKLGLSINFKHLDQLDVFINMVIIVKITI